MSYETLKSAAVTTGSGEPRVGGHRVLDVVKRAYDQGFDAAVALSPGVLDHETVIGTVYFCADRGCDEAKAWCTGCKLANDHEGITSLDAFCRQFHKIHFIDSPVTLTGEGSADRTFQSFDDLQKSWQGTEMFYLARRVVRRMVKEKSPRPKRMPVAAGASDLTFEPAIILVTPQMADNIGMVARAMANFGLEELRLVAPRDGWPNEKARAAASGANSVIDTTRAFETTAGAVGDLNWVIATTARQRHMTKPILTPEQAAEEMLRRIGEGQQVGILFGAERQGLENDDIALADAVVMVPVNPRFASLNLAQAVLLIGYEWLKAGKRGTLGRVTTFETALEPGLKTHSLPASKAEQIGLFEHLERELDKSGFLKPAEKRGAMIRTLRSLIERMEPTEQDVKTLRGVIASLTGAHRRREEKPE